MKKILGAAAFVALTSGSAFSADMSRLHTKAPVSAVPNWAGWYIGINAGGAFNHEGEFETTDGLVDAFGVRNGFRPAAATTRADGFTAGAQIGYNYQFAPNWLIGIEADASYTDLKATTSVDLAVTRTSVFTNKMDFLGTVRGRVGYIFDRLMIYGTGGLAYGNVSNDTAFLTGGDLTYFAGQSGLQAGWTAGAGIESALAQNNFLNFFGARGASLKVEYLHYDLGARSYALPPVIGGLVGIYSQRVKTAGDLVRVGFNYSFGGPIAAKY
jgi:outer membrane immunogenic protein